MTNDPTSSFYDDNAVIYATRKRNLPQSRLDAFLAALPAGASILELGCGAGQDAAYMISRGFAVTLTDGSTELAKQAEALIGRPVHILRFETLDIEGAHDGVWAEASLLHAPRAALPDILDRIRRALKDGGIFHASFKAGEAEGHDTFGRYYNYPSAAWLTALLGKGCWRDIAMTEADGGGFDGKPTKWLYVKARK
ncbi:class I SAM-dependent methyltransferase [Agrobacterium sp. SHOUNA12C]|uniref:SAM-dependent methyltransferase protein n=2 Tax=Rhizobium rhizogenes TaxID=359 RepID=B9JGH3_RHIR8|nr:class I SAM-dependent methyltransferase [Rhizobium rhizogenes]ACM26947.1 SAM-dependent methyltransferase protein [Rhizobium rhizogenes K84]KAA6489973.1 class I SAM-dependent methyltransferase [Agrobacterium sp. ICMP 7243]MCJ9720192.1 class I SAM-dependent methyltransferase [Agrobacterium sp. BETTINA12B]MCJ9755581.1 class I SAM-dependent methyltransferase [Agrobacterium sp. SHOUNA12C]OCJ26013.1 SAM-dependent methyltransferase [Agrobacterium sp. B131/95]OCJ30889.1 SAM-dependent methyltransfe